MDRVHPFDYSQWRFRVRVLWFPVRVVRYVCGDGKEWVIPEAGVDWWVAGGKWVNFGSEPSDKVIAPSPSLTLKHIAGVPTPEVRGQPKKMYLQCCTLE